MAYVYDNKTYRNLQQQVKENMDNIAELQDLKLVGIDVAGIVADYSSLPSSAEQGQVYAVGSASPYELYVYNDSSWVDFGEFPKAGPKGEQGPQGEPGRQGPRGLTGPQGPRGYTGAPGTPGKAGAQGEKGPKGDKGDPGPAGKDGTVSFDELTPEQLDMLKGPKGDAGPIGPQGPQGEQGPEGPEGPQGPQGETGATGPKGDTGPIGPQGIQGHQGPIGPEGPKGDKGDTGERGPQGPIGPQGPKGDPGEVPANVATITYVDERISESKYYADSTIATATSNMVTTDTAQIITGAKKFSGDIRLISASIDSILGKVHIEHSDNDNYVDINSYGVINLTNDRGKVDGVLRLPHKGTTSEPKIIAVTSDIPDPSKFVTTNTSQTISGNKTFNGKLVVSYDSDNDYGPFEIYDTDYKHGTTFEVGSLSTDNTITLPSTSGTLALTSNIPTKTSQLTNDSNFITSTALSGYATTSDVSTAISSQTKETWTFTLSDGSTVTKSVVLGA